MLTNQLIYGKVVLTIFIFGWLSLRLDSFSLPCSRVLLHKVLKVTSWSPNILWPSSLNLMCSILLIRNIAHNHEETFRGACCERLLIPPVNWCLLLLPHPFSSLRCRFPLIEFPRLGPGYLELETGVPGWLFVCDIFIRAQTQQWWPGRRLRLVAGGYWAQGMAMRYSISNIINNRNDFHDHELRQFAWSQVLTVHHSASNDLWYSIFTWVLLSVYPADATQKIEKMMLISSAQIFIPDLSSGASITSEIWAQTNSYPLQEGARGMFDTFQVWEGGWGHLGDTHHIPRWHLSPPCWPLHTLDILPILEISISQWLIISQTQHCWHKLC